MPITSGVKIQTQILEDKNLLPIPTLTDTLVQRKSNIWNKNTDTYFGQTFGNNIWCKNTHKYWRIRIYYLFLHCLEHPGMRLEGGGHHKSSVPIPTLKREPKSYVHISLTTFEIFSTYSYIET